MNLVMKKGTNLNVASKETRMKNLLSTLFMFALMGLAPLVPTRFDRAAVETLFA